MQNASTEAKIRCSKEECFPGLANFNSHSNSAKNQSFTKFPPIKKATEEAAEDPNKNGSTRRIEKEK